MRSALARAEEKIENEEREIERLRAQIEKLRRMLFGSRSEKLRQQVEEAEAQLKQQEQESDATTDGRMIRRFPVSFVSPAIFVLFLNIFLARYADWNQQKPTARSAAVNWNT